MVRGTVRSDGGDHEATVYITANGSVTPLGTARDGVKLLRVVKTVMVACNGSPGH